VARGGNHRRGGNHGSGARTPGRRPIADTGHGGILWQDPCGVSRCTLGGRALVLHLEGVAGYALLISYWSNELGGEVCAIDELYVAPAARGQGWGSHLIEALAAGSDLGFGDSVALAIGVSPDNTRARSLYERLGFRGKNISLARPCTGTRAPLLRRT
jgi:ribosomal protein S18 acetylase RimI-like enzyme